MKCLSITLSDFRNIAEEKCEFSDGVNVLWGKNAQGKSNMLEGVYYFARGRSFRGAKEKEMIAFGKKCARLSLDFTPDGASHSVNLTAALSAEGRKTLWRGGAQLSGAREMIGQFRAVLFCPAHLTLVSGGPSLRRSFMDIALSQLYPAYLDSLARYNRALLQRNALIHRAQTEKVDDALWEIYADQLSALGADIWRRRMDYIERLSLAVCEIFEGMTVGREVPALSLHSLLNTDDRTQEAAQNKLRLALLDDREREIRLGSTLFGVHRDDIILKLNRKDAKLYASQGQQRSLALAMKLAEGEMSKNICKEYPVFLLDDVLSELDSDRRSFIMSELGKRQMIVTSCEPEMFSKGGADKLIHINNGKITETRE